ncbi:MAG: hypothetical protein NTY74_05740 [Ignavibacteriae bacterium]|nr:hypothetical protein [Ignavibacteriota bacterium]
MKYIIQIAVVVMVMCGSVYGQEKINRDIFNFKDFGFIYDDSTYCAFDGGIGYFKVILFMTEYNKDKHTLNISGKVCDRKSYEAFCEIYAYIGSFDTVKCRLTIKNRFSIDCTGYFNTILDISADEKLYFDCLGYSLIECSIDKQKLKKYL